MRRSSALALALTLLAPACAAAEPICRELVFDGAPFTVCTAPRDTEARLVLDDADGERVGTLDRAMTLAAKTGRPLMAMNAGMYHEDRAPVGLYIEDGETRAPLQAKPGPGNFGMVPNGVFWSDGTTLQVNETLSYAERGATPDFATQSGPMLVIDGALHPRFMADSESRKRRNGVGVSDTSVHFAISDAPVNFHHFARLFRDELGATNALFLDGSVSRIIAPETGRAERGGPFGPIVVLMAPSENTPSVEETP